MTVDVGAREVLSFASICVVYIVWLIRLEAKVLYLEKDTEAHKKLVKENQDLIWKKIEEVQKDTKEVLMTLTRIEASLNFINKKD